MRKRQYERLVIFALCLIGLIIGGGAWFINQRLNIDIITQFIKYDAFISCGLFFCIIADVLLSNHIFKGFKYFWFHWLIRNHLELEMIDADICIKRDKYIEVPRIYLRFDKGFSSGLLRIKNTLRYDKRLDTVVMSSALGKFIVENHYVSDDGNYHIYELIDGSVSYKITFNSFDDYIKYCQKIPLYKLFLDSRSVVKLQHMLLIGQTGSGKTYALYSLILQMLSKLTDDNRSVKYQLFFADPKGSSVSVLARLIDKSRTAVKMNETIQLLESFVSLMQERKEEIEELLSDRLDADYSFFGLSPHIFIFDEYASFASTLASEDKKIRDKVRSLMSEVVLQGRQLGFFVILIMQKSDATLIDTAIRENIPCKIVLGNSENQTYITAFGNGVDIPNRNYHVGEGVFVEPELAPEPKLVQFPMLNFDILSAVTRTPVV